MAPLDTYALTSGIRSGDEAAFDAFYQRYADRMFHYLLVVLRGDEEHAREVLQEAMLRVIRYVKPFGTDEELWRYLAAVMRSVIVDLSRKARSAEKHDALEKVLERNVPEAEDAFKDRMLALLNGALTRLPEEDRCLIEEHYFRNVPQVEIAAVRDMSVKAVGMKMHRLRVGLRDEILKGLQNG